MEKRSFGAKSFPITNPLQEMDKFASNSSNLQRYPPPYPPPPPPPLQSRLSPKELNQNQNQNQKQDQNQKKPNEDQLTMVIPNQKQSSDPEHLVEGNNLEVTQRSSFVDLQGMASRKNAMGGALGMGLLASNIDQILSIIDRSYLSTSDYVRVGLIGFSLLLQVVTMLILLILGASGSVTPERKQHHNRLNTAAMCLSFLTTVLNVAITSLGSRDPKVT